MAFGSLKHSDDLNNNDGNGKNEPTARLELAAFR